MTFKQFASFLVICLTGVVLASGAAAQDANSLEIKELIQLPVAIDKVINGGVPKEDIVMFTEMYQDEINDPFLFSLSLRRGYYLNEERTGLGELNQYLARQRAAGASGSQFAQALHDYLIERGMDRILGERPLSENYIFIANSRTPGNEPYLHIETGGDNHLPPGSRNGSGGGGILPADSGGGSVPPGNTGGGGSVPPDGGSGGTTSPPVQDGGNIYPPGLQDGGPAHDKVPDDVLDTVPKGDGPSGPPDSTHGTDQPGSKGNR